jgi:hypothetical protein
MALRHAGDPRPHGFARQAAIHKHHLALMPPDRLAIPRQI